MMTQSRMYRRHAERAITTALSDTRVVVLNGARQTGKSTLARAFSAIDDKVELRYLDDAVTRAAALADPSGFVQHSGLMVIDEVQRVPDLMLAIKHRVDLTPEPGQFLLTGSARLFGLHDIPDLLPGRTETIDLWPLTQGELTGAIEDFVGQIFAQGVDLTVKKGTLDRQAYLERALTGGYPEALRRSDLGRRARFFESYISDLIHRDVQHISQIEQPINLRRLINVLAAQASMMLVPNQLANQLNIPVSTIRRYLELLDLLFIIHRLPAWSNNLTTRAVATSKMIFVDSGLASHLCGMTARRAAQPTAPVGPLVENFVIGELLRQLSWADEAIRPYHYRDRDGLEVDVVLEHPNGEIVLIEVKAAATVRAEDFRGIRRLAQRLGDRFVAGLVLYTGPTPLPFGERLRAWPIQALWTTTKLQS